jgi:excinuclease ABC subunit B
MVNPSRHPLQKLYHKNALRGKYRVAPEADILHTREMRFKIESEYTPSGDQPKAIKALAKGFTDGKRDQTLLGVTGSGKTYTIANVIEKIQKPTLVIAHNKTLAAQLAAEYREFFPSNAVHYFVSYYDYYQPEAYVPVTDTYIEKEAMINEDIERLRHAATQALLTRNDVIIVASVSCIYGLGSPEEYKKVNLAITLGQSMTRAALTRRLIQMYFERTTGDLSPGSFRALGSKVEIMPANERVMYRVDLGGGSVAKIEESNPITREIRGELPSVFIFPARHYVTPQDVLDAALADIEQELKDRLKELDESGKILEAERLKRRTRQDIAMIREFGFCSGIENYSRHFDRRKPGEPPYTLLNYFPRKADGSPDFLTVIDESHVSVPQIGGMYAGDRSRKLTLVEHGFRLPSAVDNRPLTFDEFLQNTGQTIYTSATPADYELQKSGEPVEMIIRPTGLVDPEIIVRPIVASSANTQSSPVYLGQVKDFIAEAEIVTKRCGRSLVTVLTKKMAEDLSQFLVEKRVKARYIHSGIATIERIEILTDFRKGLFDVLVGVNLLREGLDLPEVELVGILDADKEGFLRSETSLIQTMGRAARNVLGRVILYADQTTGSMERAISETNRRRERQLAYNKQHGITARTVAKKIHDIIGDIQRARERAVSELAELDSNAYGGDVKKLIKAKREQMHEASDRLDFETAALLRDEIRKLEQPKAVSK